MNNKNLNTVITVTVLVLTISLLKTAYEHEMWREFVVSEFVVVVTALWSLRYLRQK